MTPYISIDNKQMPAPDAKVRYAQGMFGPAMFHYLPEYADPRETAKEHGFDLLLVSMADQLCEGHPLLNLYFEKGECEKVFKAWLPQAPDKTWKIAGCHDTEDGPVAVFLRPRKTAAPTAEVTE